MSADEPTASPDGSGARRHQHVVGAADNGMRLDRFLADRLPLLSRERIKALILSGQATTGERTIVDPSYRVKREESVTLTVPAPVVATPRGQAIPLDVLYEDDHVIVIDKPAGLVVHPAPGNPDRTLVNALIAHCGDSLSGIGGVRRPGIVHRLDKGTSGVMVAAKTDLAHAALAGGFAAHEIERIYLAIVWGIAPIDGEIRGSIGRDPRHRKRLAVVTRGGKPALTRFRRLETIGNRASLMECQLATGRTHQIRVHLSHIGYPVVADPLYGGKRATAHALTDRLGPLPVQRQALHAAVLGLRHPVTRKDLKFGTELPSDMLALVKFLQRGC